MAGNATPEEGQPEKKCGIALGPLWPNCEAHYPDCCSAGGDHLKAGVFLRKRALLTFLGRYDGQVTDLKQTVSKYQETTEGKAEAEKKYLIRPKRFWPLRTSGERSRKVQGELIDGPLTQLDRAVAAHDGCRSDRYPAPNRTDQGRSEADS